MSCDGVYFARFILVAQRDKIRLRLETNVTRNENFSSEGNQQSDFKALASLYHPCELKTLP